MNINKVNKHIAISSCLVGVPCKWDGGRIVSYTALDLKSKNITTDICPEILAGLSIPRPACEIINGDGNDVLDGRARVVDKEGNDYTEIFVKGANRALKIVLDKNIHKVYLKSGSPSCAAGHINDGRFKGIRKSGVGIFTALLKRNNIEVEEIP